MLIGIQKSALSILIVKHNIEIHFSIFSECVNKSQLIQPLIFTRTCHRSLFHVEHSLNQFIAQATHNQPKFSRYLIRGIIQLCHSSGKLYSRCITWGSLKCIELDLMFERFSHKNCMYAYRIKPIFTFVVFAMSTDIK